MEADRGENLQEGGINSTESDEKEQDGGRKLS